MLLPTNAVHYTNNGRHWHKQPLALYNILKTCADSFGIVPLFTHPKWKNNTSANSVAKIPFHHTNATAKKTVTAYTKPLTKQPQATFPSNARSTTSQRVQECFNLLILAGRNANVLAAFINTNTHVQSIGNILHARTAMLLFVCIPATIFVVEKIPNICVCNMLPADIC